MNEHLDHLNSQESPDELPLQYINKWGVENLMTPFQMKRYRCYIQK